MLHLLKKIYYKYLSKYFDGRIKIYNRYNSYDEYLAKQIAKTTDPNRVAKWKGEEWNSKIIGFRDLFDRNKIYVNKKKNAICLGSRTGQEVFVLRELGLRAIGIDLVPFAPYTVKGDIHKLSYKNDEFDLVFTNIFDHSLYPKKFISEMERVCMSGGNIIINLQLNTPGDEYSENLLNDPSEVSKMFKNSYLMTSRNIKNTFDSMDYEFVFQKK